ncbi:MAG: hypothetical protein MUE49_03370, partial [Rhodospirillales bacterium]|nr:hypothetical protein [Rhodospirillales bacterium]
MFDASAYELAELDTPHAPGLPSPRSAAVTADQDQAPSPFADPATLTLAACATCQNAFGECAMQAARAGAMSPMLALALCNSVHRAVERAFSAPMTSMTSYLAFVLLGAGRSDAIGQH